MIGRSPLSVADAVGIMTDRTGHIFATHVLVVLTEAFVIENTVAVMATVAECIFNGRLRHVIERIVIAHKQVLVVRTVRAVRSGTTVCSIVIITVTIGAADDAVRRVRR